tara:strand:+ start:31202 stop:31708 length:507 start_codon:yes stop_codon:yes gene_type:complete
MLSEDFSDVRKMPQERSAVFTPEVELLRNFKDTIPNKKTSSNSRDGNPDKLYLKLGFMEQKDLIEGILAKVRHKDYMDPYILIIAAYYFSEFPDGISENDSDNRQRKLTPALFRQHAPSMIRLIPDAVGKTIRLESENRDGKNLMEKQMIDVLSYYRQIVRQYKTHVR